MDVFLATIAGVFGMIASMYGVQATLRMRSDETTLRLKPLLTTRVRRLQWTASHLVFSLLGSALLLAVSGLGAGLLYGLQVDDVRGDVPAVLGAVLAQLPAVWVVVGVAVLAFGFLLKHSVRVSWAAASMCLLVSLYGPVVRLPQPVLDIAVHAHPEVPECGVHAHPHGVADRHGRHRTFCGFGTFQRRDIG